jgi:cation transport protein ChaC
MSLTIGRAETPDDLDAVRDLIGDFFSWARSNIAGGGAPPNPSVFANLAAELAGLPGRFGPPSGCLLLARLDGAPVGCVAFYGHDATTMEIKRMFVRPEAWGKGVGREMLEVLLTEARIAGYARFLLSTHHELHAARALYRRFGFDEVAGSPDFPGIVEGVDVCMEMLPVHDAPIRSALPDTPDPFAHHPELRDRIADPETSPFRTFRAEHLVVQEPHLRDWVYPEARREAFRAEALAGHAGDLWIFGYGSLMWNPALRFVEVRRAHAAHHARRLNLVEYRGGRGTAEAPGLMATLDAGDGCDGLAFRIAAADVETETDILFQREMLAPGYRARFIPARIGDAEVRALTFLADHAVPDIRPDLTHEEQLRYVAHGAGDLGTSRDYLASIVAHLTLLGIDDAPCTHLLRAVDDHLATLAREVLPS